MFEKADRRGTQTQPLPLRLMPQDFASVLFVGGGGARSFSIFLPTHRLLGRTIFSFYLLINKLKGRSCLFSEIKNCRHNYSLSS